MDPRAILTYLGIQIATLWAGIAPTRRYTQGLPAEYLASSYEN